MFRSKQTMTSDKRARTLRSFALGHPYSTSSPACSPYLVRTHITSYPSSLLSVVVTHRTIPSRPSLKPAFASAGNRSSTSQITIYPVSSTRWSATPGILSTDRGACQCSLELTVPVRDIFASPATYVAFVPISQLHGEEWIRARPFPSRDAP
jgi:hypothetical protein